MTESNFEKPLRRPRYRGAHPRQFDQKYKERNPGKYAAEVEKVVASGKTPAGTHRPIMVREVMEFLAPQPGSIALDCTLGFGGHAQELFARVQPGGKLIAIDADPLELPKTEARLRSCGFPENSLIVRRMNYAGVLQLMLSEQPDGADVLLADLGLSSMQMDNPARGFTFKADGPLDMRMNPAHGQPVSAFLSKISEQKLACLLKNNADEPLASTLARSILQAHNQTRLMTTSALAAVVRQVMVLQSRRLSDTPDDAVRRVFQALRIAVNDEFGSLDAFLKQLPNCLKPGGRVVILSFHSGEDRRVKKAFKDGLRDGFYTSISEDVVRPSMEEQRGNPRSCSAKLRGAVRSSNATRSTIDPAK
jgi:16S rRNA (cytosine1402-N4)-methyltransferase